MSEWFEFCGCVEGEIVCVCVCVPLHKSRSVCVCVCVHVRPVPRVLSSSLLPFMKGEVQREQQMSKR